MLTTIIIEEHQFVNIGQIRMYVLDSNNSLHIRIFTNIATFE